MQHVFLHWTTCCLFQEQRVSSNMFPTSCPVYGDEGGLKSNTCTSYLFYPHLVNGIIVRNKISHNSYTAQSEMPQNSSPGTRLSEGLSTNLHVCTVSDLNGCHNKNYRHMDNMHYNNQCSTHYCGNSTSILITMEAPPQYSLWWRLRPNECRITLSLCSYTTTEYCTTPTPHYILLTHS